MSLNISEGKPGVGDRAPYTHAGVDGWPASILGKWLCDFFTGFAAHLLLVPVGSATWG